MSYVYLANSTNSQPFTTCCGTAICEGERRCPSCDIPIYPFNEENVDDDFYEFAVAQRRWHFAFERSPYEEK